MGSKGATRGFSVEYWRKVPFSGIRTSCVRAPQALNAREQETLTRYE